MSLLTLLHGDCRERLRELEDNSIDSIVTDASLITGNRLGTDVWQECLGLLKHGGHAIAICGVSNYHRVACAMEDAGFEIRDSIMWVYSSGKRTASHYNVEPIVLARKSLVGSIVENVLQYGVGAINVDGCRVVTDPAGAKQKKGNGAGVSHMLRVDPNVVYEGKAAAGRFPANLCHDGSSGVVGLFPRAGNNWKRNYGEEDYKGKQYRGGSFGGGGYKGGCTYADSGSAARFFYNTPRNPNDTSTKPLQFLRYLCRLITPPNGIVFDPFPNAQTPIEEAAKAEGFSYKRG